MRVETNTKQSTVRQISGTNPGGGYILSVLTKRTYVTGLNGRCVLAEKQLPLEIDLQFDPSNSDILQADTDLFPFKPLTDIVIKGHAQTGRMSRSFEVEVGVGAYRKLLLVVGDRRCAVSSTGSIIFSDPQPVEPVPLCYGRAYGGRDSFAEKRYGNPYEAFTRYFPENISAATASPYRYPRNPAGVGYLIEPSPEAIEQLRLPNLEDIQDPLSPARLCVGKTGRWPSMPLPQSLDWLDHGCFPRLAYFGFVHDYDPLSEPFREVQSGLVPSELMRSGPLEERFSFRFANGASLGLQLPHLRGDEDILLMNVHPKQKQFVLHLPNERPRIWADGRNGRLNPAEPLIHTVLIEPDESRLSIVWCGSTNALRPYSLEELEDMPLRVDW